MFSRIPPVHRLTGVVVGLILAIVTADLTLVARSSATQTKALKIVVIAGEDAVNIIQQKTAVAPIVEVRDENDLPVAGVLLRFRVSGGRAVFSGGLDSVTLTTNAAGRAAASGYTPLTSGTVQIDVTAAFQGQTATTTITQTNFATAAQASQAGKTSSTSGTSGAGAGAGGAGAAGATAGAAGGGMSAGTLAGLAAGGVAAAAAAVVLMRQAGEERLQILALTTSVPGGLQSATAIRFSAQVTGGTAPTYMWDFGDGATATEPSPSHVYDTPGMYVVRVTVTDAGQSSTSEGTVTIRALTGTWQSPGLGSGAIIMTLAQSGAAVSGSNETRVTGVLGDAVKVCTLTGSVQTGTPTVLLRHPQCPQPPYAPYADGEYRLEPGPEANTLTGTFTQLGGFTFSVMFTRQ